MRQTLNFFIDGNSVNSWDKTLKRVYLISNKYKIQSVHKTSLQNPTWVFAFSVPAQTTRIGKLVKVDVIESGVKLGKFGNASGKVVVSEILFDDHKLIQTNSDFSCFLPEFLLICY